MVNAITLLEITLFIFILSDKIKYPQELAIVIAHEIGHIEHQHIRELYVKNIIFSYFTGSNPATILSTLISSKYSRENEREADVFASNIMKENFIRPEYFVSLFKILNKGNIVGNDSEKVLSYISTHPATNDRIIMVQDRLKNIKYSTKEMFSNFNWQKIKNICNDL